MEKRAIVAFVLSVAIFLVWGYFFAPPSQQKAPTSQQPLAKEEVAKEKKTGGEPVRTEGQAPAEIQPGLPPSLPKLAGSKAEEKPREIIVRHDLYTAIFTEAGGRLKSLTMKKYRSALELNAPPQELVVIDSKSDMPLGLSFKAGRGPDLRQAFFKSDSGEAVEVGESQPANLVMTYRDPNGFEAERRYTFTPGSYLIGVNIKLSNRSSQNIDDNLILEMISGQITNKEQYAGFAAWLDNELHEIKPKDIEKELEKVKNKNYSLTWAGYQDQYFLAAVLPVDQERTRITAGAYEKNGVRVNFINPPLEMPPQTQKTYQYYVFYGPKDYQVLKETGHELDRSIYFGWVDILSKPLLIAMTWLHGYVGNYGVVIIIITILVKILFWPLTAKSYKSMKSMQKIQPQIMKLREKYKDDRQAMNQEMMQLYKTYKVNPLGGCLPLVIQIPVFIALYRLLDYSLELRHAPFCLWMKDLAAPDRLFHFNFSIPLMEPPYGIPVLTLLMGASMLIQQKLSPTPGDPTQAKVMMLMPIFFTFIFINFPTGLVLYWLVNNILSIGQQTLINKRTT